MEHRHFLSPLFEPASVLLVLENDAPGGWIEALPAQLAESSCRVATYRLTDGKKLPEPGFDLAVIAVDNRVVSSALEVAAGLKARAAIVMCDRADAAEARSWAGFAQRSRIRLLGPGAMGVVRPGLKLNADRMGPLPADGGVALVSQSGVLGGAILDWAAGTVIGFSLAVSLGAEADIDMAEVLDFLASDPRTKSVVVYLEAVRDSRSFMSALRALATVKPVVVLKGNRDGAPRRRALTHSGAFVGSDAIYSAALRRAGAVQVRLFTQLFTAARILASNRSVLGTRIGVLGNGNAPGVLVADMALWNPVRLPAPSAATAEALTAKLPGVLVENPMNLGVGAKPADYSAAIEAFAADREFDGVMVTLAAYSGVDAAGVTDAVIAASKSTRKPLFACWMGDRSVRGLWRALDDAAIPVFRTPEAAVDAYSTVATFHQNQLLLQQTPRSLSGLETPDLEGARILIDSAIAERRQVLTEMESKALLGAFHVPVTRTVIARSPTEAIVVAEQMGFPVAMKISSFDVTHKSDVGGVVLNVRNAAEVRSQYAEILAAVRRAQPEARIDGVTLQAMRRSRFPRELYVGVFRDPLFGPVISFGAGGTRIEVVRDTTLEFPPLNRFLARRMIERTRVAESLGEFRGAPPIDFEQLETLLVRVSEMVCELPWISEMDINPVIVDESGVVAVDARIVLEAGGDSHPVRYAHMAIMPYPAHLTQVRSSPDGQFYTIRPIQSEDADRLQSFVRALSEESRYFRFISTLSELTPRMLVRYTQVDYDRELALVAVVGPDDASPDAGAQPQQERIVGVVRYLLNPDRESCEFAVAIADDWQGKRLGSTLMRAIVEAARSKGLKRIEGYVLSSNSKMLGMMSYLGFTIETDREDPTMKIVWMALN
jgi:acetyltransferase